MKKSLTTVLIGMTTSWVFISAAVHASVGGGLYYYFAVRQPAPIVADLDLSMTPLVAMPPNQGGGRGAKEPEKWVLPKMKNQKAPTPVVPTKIETKEEVKEQESRPAPCEGNCAEGPVVGQGWGGGTGEGDGEYVPADQTARKPRWIRNFITSRDYPLVARQEGKDGRVVLTVLIDSEGRVRDVRLLEGSYPVFNEVALRKVRDAVFTPAYNAQMKAVSCKVTLPIRFELK